MSRLAIITARGGSKRIPKKNIREFCGKPILAYSIWGAYPEGMSFAILIMNACVPLINKYVKPKRFGVK